MHTHQWKWHWTYLVSRVSRKNPRPEYLNSNLSGPVTSWWSLNFPICGLFWYKNESLYAGADSELAAERMNWRSPVTYAYVCPELTQFLIGERSWSKYSQLNVGTWNWKRERPSSGIVVASLPVSNYKSLSMVCNTFNSNIKISLEIGFNGNRNTFRISVARKTQSNRNFKLDLLGDDRFCHVPVYFYLEERRAQPASEIGGRDGETSGTRMAKNAL